MPKKENKIVIIVETIEGESVAIDINVNNRVELLMKKAMDELSITPGNITYEMLYNDTKLNLGAKIEQYNIQNKEIVIMQRVAKVGK